MFIPIVGSLWYTVDVCFIRGTAGKGGRELGRDLGHGAKMQCRSSGGQHLA